MRSSKTILLAAGGTGGHIFPAEALAEVLRARGFEPHLITDKRFHGYITGNTNGALREIPIHTISSGSLQGGVLRKIKNLFSIALGVVQAAGWIQKLQPIAVVGFGGYPSFPTMLAAVMLKRRTILHEQNSVLGRVNRALAPYVSCIATTYTDTKLMPKAARDRAKHTGNPVRLGVQAIRSAPYPPMLTPASLHNSNFGTAVPPQSPLPQGGRGLGEGAAKSVHNVDAPSPNLSPLGGEGYAGARSSESGSGFTLNLLVLGGSQGASVFSEVVPKAMALLPEHLRARIVLTQQCRAAELDATRAHYDGLNMKVTLAPFFTDIPERLKAAHLVISRAGASSVAELMVAGRPAILVPLPSAADNHQFFNAQSVEQNGAGWVITQPDFTPESLANRLKNLLKNPEQLPPRAAAMHTLGTPDTAERLAGVVVG